MDPVLFLYEYLDIIIFFFVHLVTYLMSQDIVRKHKRYLAQPNLERTFMAHMAVYATISLAITIPFMFFTKYPIGTIVMAFLTHVIVLLIVVYLYVANAGWIVRLFAPIDKLQKAGSSSRSSHDDLDNDDNDDDKNNDRTFWEEMMTGDVEDDEINFTKDDFIALFKNDKDKEKDKENENAHFKIPHNKTLYGYLVDACLFYPMAFAMTFTFYVLLAISYRDTIQNTIKA